MTNFFAFDERECLIDGKIEWNKRKAVNNLFLCASVVGISTFSPNQQLLNQKHLDFSIMFVN